MRMHPKPLRCKMDHSLPWLHWYVCIDTGNRDTKKCHDNGKDGHAAENLEFGPCYQLILTFRSGFKRTKPISDMFVCFSLSTIIIYFFFIHLYLCRREDWKRQARCFTKADSLFTVPMFSAISESAPGNSHSLFRRDSRMLKCYFTAHSHSLTNAPQDTLKYFLHSVSVNPLSIAFFHHYLLWVCIQQAKVLHDSGGKQILSQ